MNSVTLHYIDTLQKQHELRLLGKAPQMPGFYRVFSITANKLLTLSYDQITFRTDYGDARACQEWLDVLLRDQAARLNPQPSPDWREWRNDGPAPGTQIEVRGNGAHKLVLVHSAAECDSLRQQGYTEWRAV